jgi:glycosyltransferase involved in cell wall biosynthesis
LLVIAGSGARDYRNALRRESDDLDLGQNVVWTGFLEGEDKSAAFAAATMFVLPSYSENFGVAAAEALMAGVATIVTEQVGIAEEILRAEAGWVVASDALALSDAMVKLLNERETRERLSRRGRMLAENRFSEEVVGRALVQLYDSILTEKAKPVARSI